MAVFCRDLYSLLFIKKILTIYNAQRWAVSESLCARQGMTVHVQDGAEFVAAAAERVRNSMPDHSGYYDLAFIDTFNGNDDLPDSLFGPGKPVSDLWNNLCCNLKRIIGSGCQTEPGY